MGIQVDETTGALGNKGAGTRTYAGIWIRLGALILDLLILILGVVTLAVFAGLVAGLISLFKESSSGFAMTVGAIGEPIALILIVLYFPASWNRFGYTAGMRICGLRVLSENGENPTFAKALIRWLTGYSPYFLLLFSTYPAEWGPLTRELPGLGYVMAICIMIGVDKRKQGWHDKAARTFVVRVLNNQSE